MEISEHVKLHFLSRENKISFDITVLLSPEWHKWLVAVEAHELD